MSEDTIPMTLVKSPPTGIIINPDAWYTDDDVAELLRMDLGTVKVARRRGDIRSSRRGNKSFMLGAWVDDWMRLKASGGNSDWNAKIQIGPKEIVNDNVEAMGKRLLATEPQG